MFKPTPGEPCQRVSTVARNFSALPHSLSRLFTGPAAPHAIISKEPPLAENPVRLNTCLHDRCLNDSNIPLRGFLPAKRSTAGSGPDLVSFQIALSNADYLMSLVMKGVLLGWQLI